MRLRKVSETNGDYSIGHAQHDAIFFVCWWLHTPVPLLHMFARSLAPPAGRESGADGMLYVAHGGLRESAPHRGLGDGTEAGSGDVLLRLLGSSRQQSHCRHGKGDY